MPFSIALEPAVEPARLQREPVRAGDLAEPHGLVLGREVAAVHPGADQDLLVPAGVLGAGLRPHAVEVDERRAGVAVVPAALVEHRDLELLVPLARVEAAPEVVVLGVLEHVDQPAVHEAHELRRLGLAPLLEPGVPVLAGAEVDVEHAGAGVPARADRGVDPAVRQPRPRVRRVAREGRLQVRRLRRGRGQLPEAVGRDPVDPDVARRPRLGGGPLDRVVAVGVRAPALGLELVREPLRAVAAAERHDQHRVAVIDERGDLGVDRGTRTIVRRLAQERRERACRRGEVQVADEGDPVAHGDADRARGGDDHWLFRFVAGGVPRGDAGITSRHWGSTLVATSSSSRPGTAAARSCCRC